MDILKDFEKKENDKSLYLKEKPSTESPVDEETIHVSSSKLTEIDAKTIGKSIAIEMKNQGYHPVILFGSTSSGKSTLLNSLFTYLKMNSSGKSIGFSLSEPLIPTNTIYGKTLYDEAKAFFNRGTQDFIDGHGAPVTLKKNPFFIPVKVNPIDADEIKFAFLESNGEWYQPLKINDEYTIDLYPELKEEINAIIQYFEGGISFIYLAPYTKSNTDSKKQNEIKNANLALVGVMDAYQRLRKIHREDDKHIFLLTKWDEKDVTLEKLSFVTDADRQQVINILYKQGFAAFNTLEIPEYSKAILQYCAAIMSGRDVLPSEKYLPILNKYRKTLWNWLYGNATEFNSDIGRRLELVSTPPPPKKSFFTLLTEKVSKWFG